MKKFKTLVPVLFTLGILAVTALPVAAVAGQWSASGNTIYYMDGPVGIGWNGTGGAMKLHARYDAGTGAQIPSASANAFQFVGSGSSAVTGDYRYVAANVANGYNSAANTGVGTNIGLNVWVGGGDKNYAAIFEGGNVGIGTVDPVTRLEVNGTGTSNWTGRFIDASTDVRFAYQGNGIFASSSTPSSGYLMSLWSGSNNRMYVNNDGTVCLGKCN